MSTEVKVPTLGESVTEAIVAQWFKQPGDSVAQDEAIAELETDKVTLEVNATSAGTLSEIKVEEGETVEVGAVLAILTEGEAPAKPANDAKKKEESKPAEKSSESKQEEAPSASPAAAKMMKENEVDMRSTPGTGKGGRITKEDVMKQIEGGDTKQAGAAKPASAPKGEREEERVRMSTLRRRIAQRLKDSQNTAAILSTFNEIDMSNVMAFRKEYKEAFEKKYGGRLGFMSFFVKAACTALQEIPAVNAQIDGDHIIYKHYCDVGVAVGTPNGLVVPVVRDAHAKSLPDIELEIAELAKKARDGKLTMEELTGGTFTISNGGVYGSMMSTPIINPPQSGILGMHATKERPVVVDGEIVIRPMMYIALSYDHRIIDGSESVTFLKRIKELVEDPQRLLLDV